MTAGKENASIILGAGCFWCVEAVFERLQGVTDVESGYAGGSKPNPTYEEVCSGATGHAEVAKVTYDPSAISLKDILRVFWASHDPTTRDRQGADSGTQYRSVIFYRTEEERVIAEQSRSDAQKDLSEPIVTEVTPLTGYFPAENYHQDYYRKNGAAGYCQVVIRPKLQKLGLEGSKGQVPAGSVRP
ncbi:MAG: peptide-methionine (S)-S-oxide reductase MsrA [Ignavibacteria bacterium]|nr:peptide-methionine (S)-S-oxide reductase MsrA [Ignavibacteria bacterium]